MIMDETVPTPMVLAKSSLKAEQQVSQPPDENISELVHHRFTLSFKTIGLQERYATDRESQSIHSLVSKSTNRSQQSDELTTSLF
jgi:hypothetical protein